MRIWFLIGLFLLVSCNSELAKLSPINSTEVRIETTKVRIETTNAGAFSKMMIYALKSDGSHGFARLFTTLPIIEEDVPVGLYHFYGMSFSGLNSEKCSKTPASLSGDLNQVTLDFQELTCGDSDFLGSDPDLNTAGPPNVTFPTTSLEFCDSVQNITAGTDRCSDNLVEPMLKHKRGQAMSANVTLMTFERSLGRTITGAGLPAGCMNVSPVSDLRGLSPTNVPNFLPAGNGSTTPFLVRFEIYANSANCTTDTPHVLDLQNGLAVNNSLAKQIVTPGLPATRKIFVKMGENEICQGDNLAADFAGGTGVYNSPKLICNESQLYNIFPRTNSVDDYRTRANYSYKLLSHIDLSDNPVIGGDFNPPWASCVLAGSNFMPIGTTWNGTVCANVSSTGIHFFGNDKTIKGMAIIKSEDFSAFYLMTTHAGGQPSYFQNLTITDSTFISGAHSASLVAHSTRTSFSNITLQNNFVRSVDGPYAGALVGESFGTPINNVHGTGLTVVGNEYVGGLVGQTQRAGDDSMTNISDSSIRGSVAGTTHVGGLVGRIGMGSSDLYPSNILRSSFVGVLSGTKSLGGIAGQALSTRIEHSYAKVSLEATANGDVQLGGLVGFMTKKIIADGIPSGIYGSYITGDFRNSCTAVPAATCGIGTVVGLAHGSFSAEDFETVAYPFSDHLTTTTTVFGSRQADDASFMSSNPMWVSTLNGASIMSAFPTTVWQFPNGRFPYLVGEPNP
jgi:hypothetical protein